MELASVINHVQDKNPTELCHNLQSLKLTKFNFMSIFTASAFPCVFVYHHYVAREDSLRDENRIFIKFYYCSFSFSTVNPDA